MAEKGAGTMSDCVSETDSLNNSPAASEASDGSSSVDDARLAFQGITLLLNNEWGKAQALYSKHKDYSPIMCAGNSFVAFLQAIMTFEEEKQAEAMKALHETEKRCETNDGFVKVMKRKMKKKSEKCVNMEDRLQRQIVLADSILYQAVLTFINQDLSSYLKGGWLLRRAWKIYEKTYREIKDMYDKQMSDKSMGDVGAVGTPSSGSEARTDDWSIHSSSDCSDRNDNQLPEDIAARLLGSVSFGYGVFQLCISMVPPKLLKLIEFLGFEGDRDVGLSCLEYASHSRDMKAPLATLGLLWYHTVIRPFFALDGATVDAGVDDALLIIEQSEKEYPKSALFLFFKGRVQRLQSQLDASLATYRLALESCENQREIQLICLHEIGWLNMMRLQWAEAIKCFLRLKEESRWSKSYYCYLTAVIKAVMGDIKGANTHFRDLPKLVRRKNNQIEAFVLRRTEKLKKVPLTVEHATLMACEILYLWNALPTCTEEDLKTMLIECGKQTNKHLFHLESLIEGAIYRELGETEMSMQCFEEAIARHSGMKDDHHVAAFALYELGVMLAKTPATHQQGKKALTDAKEHFRDYDFENRLNVRIHAALKRLKSDGTPV